MSKATMKGLLMVALIGLVQSYPAIKDQDYLEYLGQLAAAKGRDVFSGNPDAFDVLYDPERRYSPQYKSLAIQALEQEMNREDPDRIGLAEAEEEVGAFSGKLSVMEGWPVQSLKLGQIGGVAVCPEGYPHVFHRASRTWDIDSFDENNVFTKQEQGPINEATILTLNASNGVILDQWGEKRFYMPHGLTIDNAGNLWLTDVALHQVFKYSPKKELLLSLGQAFVPAKDEQDKARFCKPTDVAVTSNGDFFVADGYCNSRVVKYSATGEFLGQFGLEDLDVPHSLALVEHLDLICVADRENMRILCYNAGLENPQSLGERVSKYDDESLGRVYAIAYSQLDGLMYGVGTGEDLAQGFTIDMSEDQGYYTNVISSWSPNDKGFTSPHDLAVSPDGEAIYVGEVTNGQQNFWKFTKAVELTDEHEQVEEEQEQVDDEDDEAKNDEEEVEEEEEVHVEDSKDKEDKKMKADKEDMKKEV